MMKAHIMVAITEGEKVVTVFTELEVQKLEEIRISKKTPYPKIEAIKLIRNLKGLTLQDAKFSYEAMEAERARAHAKVV